MRRWIAKKGRSNNLMFVKVNREWILALTVSFFVVSQCIFWISGLLLSGGLELFRSFNSKVLNQFLLVAKREETSSIYRLMDRQVNPYYRLRYKLSKKKTNSTQWNNDLFIRNFKILNPQYSMQYGCLLAKYYYSIEIRIFKGISPCIFFFLTLNLKE